MTVTQLRVSRALWLRRERWRHNRWRYHHNSGASRELRGKWWSLYVQARDIRIRRDRQILVAVGAVTGRRAALVWAAKYVGVVERPASSNRGPHITGWQRRLGSWLVGQPWCGTFVANALLHAGVEGVTSRLASVALIEDDARNRKPPFSGWQESAEGAARGDLVVIGGRGVHVELIDRVESDGSVRTIGGNTSSGVSGSQSNGGGVWRRHRKVGQVHGIARVKYPSVN